MRTLKASSVMRRKWMRALLRDCVESGIRGCEWSEVQKQRLGAIGSRDCQSATYSYSYAAGREYVGESRQQPGGPEPHRLRCWPDDFLFCRQSQPTHIF